MNEPEHPHFVLSDGRYCHVLQEGLIVSKKLIPEDRPIQKDGPDVLSLGFLITGIAIATFFMVMCFITGFYVVDVMLGTLNLLMIYSFIRALGFSQTELIPRTSVLDVKYTKRNFAYDYFVVHYTGKSGNACKRRFIIYDSQECLDQALSVMKTEGLMK